ncbi:transmembrane and coiled-coil domain-containing protein 4 isoform X4 [Lathamus discolor]|uniref:transmembrane and coiled-coil domain-containing protein 4 isoform X4 n=1 Tax=Lathamus discolor TaxID=678569 RepID=UPI0032B7873D
MEEPGTGPAAAAAAIPSAQRGSANDAPRCADRVKMAAEEKWKCLSAKQHSGTGEAGEKEPGVLLSQQLAEPARFAYAALCGISLAWLFPEEEQSSFRMGFIEGFVKWLDLPNAVLPAMTAFANGLGGEGTETFAQLLLQDPILKENPVVITQDLLSFSLRDGYYDARARVLICHISWLLRIPLEELEVLEESLLESLKEQKEEESETAEAARKKKERRKKLKRYLLIGLATIGGGTVIGLTGGLAAPVVAAGAATVIGSAGAAALGSTAGIAVMASLFGAAGAGLTGYKMKKRVGAIEEFEFLPLTEGKQLHITIAITGWLCAGKYGSFTAPWSSMLQSSEQYCLAWESKYLMELGNALDTLLNGFVNMMAQEALKFTVLSGIVTALTWPTSLLTVASVIDNPWGVCLHRSAEVGKHLAHILLSRQQGKRPVTLIGFSLGARVIYFCLQEMAQEKDFQGIIEDVVLLGAPVEGDPKYWKPIAKVVSGRIINGYCRSGGLAAGVCVQNLFCPDQCCRPPASRPGGQEDGKPGPFICSQRPPGLHEANGHDPQSCGHKNQGREGQWQLLLPTSQAVPAGSRQWDSGRGRHWAGGR